MLAMTTQNERRRVRNLSQTVLLSSTSHASDARSGGDGIGGELDELPTPFAFDVCAYQHIRHAALRPGRADAAARLRRGLAAAEAVGSRPDPSHADAAARSERNVVVRSAEAIVFVRRSAVI